MLLNVQIAFSFLTANTELVSNTESRCLGINAAAPYPKKNTHFDEACWKGNTAKDNIVRRSMPHAQQKFTNVRLGPLTVDLKSPDNYGHRYHKSRDIFLTNTSFVGKLQKYLHTMDH